LRRAGRRVLRGPAGPLPDDKQLVDQARLVWVFSHAHRKGFDDQGLALQAAARGRRFLQESFLDREHGGYVWMTDRAGLPVNPVKHLYGQAFVIFSLVEYARASGDAAALHDAIALHRSIEGQLHDDVHGGWREHGDADWSVLADDDPRIRVPFPGRKSANTVMHWIEALTELYSESGDARCGASLTEALAVARRFLFPLDPAHTYEARRPDWTIDPDATPGTYGHDVEFAWLMVRAQQALGLEPAWEQLYAYLDHTLLHGFDHRRGGVFTSGPRDGAADRRDKVWWVQYEFVAALIEALVERHDERYACALARTLTFVERHLTDRHDGVAFESVREDGRPRSRRKAGHWKAGYHEVRATVKLVDAFAR
jgi:mannose/cellobiose epimerase-like protein (N-acyl-D-glucosamine 2-epimerase family)